MSVSRILYLPIEEAVRDLDARILLALRAVDAGWQVVFGQQWLLVRNLRAMPAGVIYFKGANRIQSSWMQEATRTGNLVIACDEEATVLARPDILKRNVNDEALQLVHAFFAQGRHQRDVLSQLYPQFASKIRMSGSTRFDLLRPQYLQPRLERAKALKEQYGDFILINTNFGYANSNWGSPEDFEKILENVGIADFSREEDRQMVKDRYDFEKSTMDAFMSLIPRLAERFPDQSFVIRPHPAEDSAIWEELINDKVKNAHAIFEGSVIDWILASKLLIQNSCTTGIEAAFMKCPCVSYAIGDHPFLDVYTSNRVSNIIFDENTLIDVVDQVCKGNPEKVAQYFLKGGDFAEYFHLEDKRLACDVLFEQIVEIVSGRLDESGRWEKRDGYLESYPRQKWQVNKFDKSLGQMVKDVSRIADGNKFAHPGEMRLENVADSLFLLTRPD
ncbi:hypothetical protein NUH88_13115 [Nisaea acidiphila]|uniref:Surface carbohydrate biosynthesis protein n=1 Tax=Nisaea acidiphila TaxID=1862145 RepID=A0A9J7ALK1_9PROT|nr:surface carbohydrate biosynthesis protein [Nisaea acidiphila]UUX48352.1 hypothetical protein NUH88_13115 [Nisaea acidiphila]